MASKLARFALVAALVTASTAAAAAAEPGGFGLGPRLAFLKTGGPADPGSYFRGGQIRLRLSPRIGLEGSLDYRRELFEDGQTKVTTYPAQASLLISLLPGVAVNPYLLGGIGYYSARTTRRALSSSPSTETTHSTGYHVGFGAEIAAGRHVGLHADYRYTGVSLGLRPEGSGITNRLAIRHGGHMWTAGVTVFF